MILFKYRKLPNLPSRVGNSSLATRQFSVFALFIIYIIGRPSWRSFSCPFGLRRFPVWRGCSNIKEVVAFVHDALIASAAQSLGFDLWSKSLTLGNAQTSLALLSLNRNFLCHALVVVTLALVLGLGKDVDAK